jgi:hypothetical protein
MGGSVDLLLQKATTTLLKEGLLQNIANNHGYARGEEALAILDEAKTVFHIS